MAAIPPGVFNSPEVSLRIWFNDGARGWAMLAPDQRITAVGYALMADSVVSDQMWNSRGEEH